MHNSMFIARELFLGLVGSRAAVAAGAVVAPITPAATGGVETVINPSAGVYRRVHTFLSSGNLVVDRDIASADYLIVPSGGGGGCNQYESGGGGSAGTPSSGSMALSAGTENVVVGIGGLGGNPASLPTDGASSSAFGVTAPGGTRGAYSRRAGFDGENGSGAGAVSSGDAFAGGIGSSGRNGGNSAPFIGGGGAGAGGSGDDAVDSPQYIPVGGAGIFSSISGVNVEYSHGGAAVYFNGVGADPVPNSGNGGNASGRAYQGNVGKDGADGVVIVAYDITEAEYLAEAA